MKIALSSLRFWIVGCSREDCTLSLCRWEGGEAGSKESHRKQRKRFERYKDTTSRKGTMERFVRDAKEHCVVSVSCRWQIASK